MSKKSCVAAEKHRRCVLRMARAELLRVNEKKDAEGDTVLWGCVGCKMGERIL